jgi:hypothetical protein
VTGAATDPRRADLRRPQRRPADGGGPRLGRGHRKGGKRYCCSLLLLGLNRKGKWVWGLMEMLPPGARRSSQGQRSGDGGWRTDSRNLELCYHVTEVKRKMEDRTVRLYCNGPKGVYIYMRAPKP